jgi:hypothetical protein
MADPEEGPQHVESSEEDDVTAAVAKSKQRDEGLETLLARIGSHKEAAALSSDDDEEVCACCSPHGNSPRPMHRNV